MSNNDNLKKIEITRQPSIIGLANTARFFPNYIKKERMPVFPDNFVV
jgi:hypothetical protein